MKPDEGPTETRELKKLIGDILSIHRGRVLNQNCSKPPVSALYAWKPVGSGKFKAIPAIVLFVRDRSGVAPWISLAQNNIMGHSRLDTYLSALMRKNPSA
jgi:hypothetical protein